MAMTGPVESVLPLQATLGEGPVWIAREAALYCVDIKAHRVHRYDPASGEHRHWQAPAQIGWVLPAEDGTLLAGLQGGVARFDPATGSFGDPLVPPGHRATDRLNDAAVDAAGRVWFGSMDDGEAAETGGLFVLAGGAIRDTGLPRVAITNGPAIAPDGRTLYHTDTLGRVIHAVPVNDDGTLGSPSVFATIDAADGHPDGAVCDADGFVWTGLWGGWRVRRYDPAGAIVQEVRFPCANITKIAFGGPDLRTAYATTARKGLDAAALAAQPEAGNLFAFEAGVAGLPGAVARTA